jgi:hypothetical protein
MSIKCRVCFLPSDLAKIDLRMGLEAPRMRLCASRLTSPQVMLTSVKLCSRHSSSISRKNDVWCSCHCSMYNGVDPEAAEVPEAIFNDKVV